MLVRKMRVGDQMQIGEATLYFREMTEEKNLCVVVEAPKHVKIHHTRHLADEKSG